MVKMMQLPGSETEIAVSRRPRFRLQLLQTTHVARPAVESFIHDVFAHAYGAKVNQFLPQLLSLQTSDGKVQAALGIRSADTGKLFLETYLDEPVEHRLARELGTTVSRHKVVEVGNLASSHRGGLRNLIVALTAYLSGADTEWAVFTAVSAVRKAFAGMNIPLYTLAAADKSRLGDAAEDWGNYYDHAPIVYACRVADAFNRIREAMYRESLLRFSLYLWECAFFTGYRQRMQAVTGLIPMVTAEQLS